MEEACRLAGLSYRKEGTTLKNEMAETTKKEKAIIFCIDFIKKDNRKPKRKDFIEAKLENVWDVIMSKGRSLKIYQTALNEIRDFIPVVKPAGYTDEKLLHFLVLFEKENGRRPSASDSRRKLVPAVGTYAYHFGSWKKAVKLAFND